MSAIPTIPSLSNDLDVLAWLIARDGASTLETAVQAVVARALRVGVTGPTIGVLADPGASDIARARAYGMVIGEIERGEQTVAACPPARVAA